MPFFWYLWKAVRRDCGISLVSVIIAMPTKRRTNALTFIFHYESMPIQIYWKFYDQKMKIFR